MTEFINSEGATNALSTLREQLVNSLKGYIKEA